MASSSCADNLLQETSTADTSENHLQPFYVLHKASKSLSYGKSTRRKRKTKSATDECQTDSDIRLKMDAFRYVWSKIEHTIKEVLRSINADAFDEIRKWVIESFNALQGFKMPEITTKASHSYPVLYTNSEAVSQRRLFSGLVLTKNMEIVDDILTFEELRLHMTHHGCHVANVSSLDFCSKNGIGGCLRSLLRQFLLVDVDAADISLLASWYAKDGNCEKPLVVIIEDLERCCGAVLSELIVMLSEWAVKIPIILIMGVATNIDAPRNTLSSHALGCLSASAFVLKSPPERLDSVIEAVFIKRWAGFSVGHMVATFLRNYFLRQDGTLTSFIRALKIALVQLLSVEPLSFTLKRLVDGEEAKGLCVEDLAKFSKTMIRHTFLLPSYCINSGNRNCQAEPDLNCLAKGLSELQRLNDLWRSMVMCLYEAGKHCNVSLLDLHWELLNPELCVTMFLSHQRKRGKDMQAGLSGLGHASEKHKFIDQVILNLSNLPAAMLGQLLKTWEMLVQGNTEVQTKIVELQSLVQNADNLHSKKELTDTSKRHISQGRIKRAKDESALNEKAKQLVCDMMREYLQPIESIPFHEIVCFKDVDKLQSALTGNPRRRIQSDLLEFQKILKCCCCSKGGILLSPSMHDTSIMYMLAQEHGDLINLHDWFQSFKATISCRKQRSRQLPSPKKRKVSSVPQNESDASIQAIIELQIAGLLRAPGKRRPDYVLRVAFGL
ncbi:hypothetical protein DM860_013007 [Cuscuta australis]|uniref:Uncharacterized protein n=1 Tax=Cuscuta australis TaxID=267555 RepID=A0A328D2X5_9ASTE|nr:hypothetical protein DM860_013007 [Cuscuta australis]